MPHCMASCWNVVRSLDIAARCVSVGYSLFSASLTNRPSNFDVCPRPRLRRSDSTTSCRLTRSSHVAMLEKPCGDSRQQRHRQLVFQQHPFRSQHQRFLLGVLLALEQRELVGAQEVLRHDGTVPAQRARELRVDIVCPALARGASALLPPFVPLVAGGQAKADVAGQPQLAVQPCVVVVVARPDERFRHEVTSSRNIPGRDVVVAVLEHVDEPELVEEVHPRFRIVHDALLQIRVAGMAHDAVHLVGYGRQLVEVGVGHVVVVVRRNRDVARQLPEGFQAGDERSVRHLFLRLLRRDDKELAAGAEAERRRRLETQGRIAFVAALAQRKALMPAVPLAVGVFLVGVRTAHCGRQRRGEIPLPVGVEVPKLFVAARILGRRRLALRDKQPVFVHSVAVVRQDVRGGQPAAELAVVIDGRRKVAGVVAAAVLLQKHLPRGRIALFRVVAPPFLPHLRRHHVLRRNPEVGAKAHVPRLVRRPCVRTVAVARRCRPAAVAVEQQRPRLGLVGLAVLVAGMAVEVPLA